MKRLEGKVAIVTGASSGIGAATARRFAEEGARLVLADIEEEGGRKLAEELRGTGSEAEFQLCDVGELEQVEALVAASLEHFGSLQILFNNAGVGTYGKTPDLEPEIWHRVLNVNLNSVFYCCRAAIPAMREAGGGSIVNTASVSGLFGDFGLTAYNAAKGAVVNYTRSLALDHAREGIRVNAVCPGPVETGLTTAAMNLPGQMERFRAAVPLGRAGYADEIAAAVAFLASDDASFITGENLVVDGGMTIHTGQPSYSALLKDD
jgi:meso-butanediol dehydrogenase/(S,S)-butanediol dehydrogenase/diacetyl reductase